MNAPKKPGPKSAAVPRRDETGDNQRAPLHQAAPTGQEMEVGGVKFRRTRVGLDPNSKKRLDIPAEALNDELKYRWVNDDGSAVERRRELGYETVDKASLGGKIETTRRVGTKKDGSPLNAVLMATPKQWHDERHATAEDRRKQVERGTFSVDGDGKELGKEFYNKGSKVEN